MTDDRPNIVLVTVDSLRADRCGFMGCEKDLTPALDRMAEEGTVFENAIAPGPATPESMPVIFTGSYPVPLGDDSMSELGRERRRIRHHMGARETLAERLSRQGYTTGAFTPNPFTSRYFNFGQGFDQFEDFMGGSRASGSLYERVFEGFLKESGLASTVRPVLNLLQREEVFKPWESFYDDVIEWTRQVEEPYFLWVMLMDVHNPYLVPDEYRSQSAWAMWHGNWRMFRENKQSPFSEMVEERLVTAYEDTVRYVDDFFGRLSDDVTDATFVVTSDHGEAFGEHGTYGHEPFLHEENIRVPLVISESLGESTSVRTPFTLRNSPQLMERIADPELPIIDRSRALVIARTDKGESYALCGTDWQYVDNSVSGEIYTMTDESFPELENKDLLSDLRTAVEWSREDATERRRVAGQTERLASAGKL